MPSANVLSSTTLGLEGLRRFALLLFIASPAARLAQSWRRGGARGQLLPDFARPPRRLGPHQEEGPHDALALDVQLTLDQPVKIPGLLRDPLVGGLADVDKARHGVGLHGRGLGGAETRKGSARHR